MKKTLDEIFEVRNFTNHLAKRSNHYQARSPLEIAFEKNVRYHRRISSVPTIYYKLAIDIRTVVMNIEFDF